MYIITEDGDVYTTRCRRKEVVKYPRRRAKESIILKSQQTDKKGYKRVGIQIDGKTKSYKVHRLVAETYLPNPNNLPEVNHIDEDKTNNKVSNLEWCTHDYNIQYSLAKSYIVENVKTGERQIITNLSAFCRHINGSIGTLHGTLHPEKTYNGKHRLTHKGYKLIEEIERTK